MKKPIAVLTFWLLAAVMHAQQLHDISFSVMHESIAFPLTRLTPIHPGFEMGTSLRETEHPHTITSINLHLGWYLHRKVEQGFYLKMEYNVQFKVHKALSLDLAGGLGYLHTFYPGILYELNRNTGDFEKTRQWGRPHALGNVGVGLSYRNRSAAEPFVRQDLAVETPFANGIPVIIHSFLKAGTKLKIK